MTHLVDKDALVAEIEKIIADETESIKSFEHDKPCEELGCYCSSFIGYHSDYRMSDEEEQDLVEKLRKGE